MKYLVLGDIHGSYEPFSKAIAIFKKQKCNCLICLGDTLFGGDNEDAKKIKAELDKIENVVMIQGNCDTYLDEEILGKRFVTSHLIKSGKKTFYFCHGHVMDENTISFLPSDAIIVHGHYHKNYVYSFMKHEVISLSSISLPRGESKPSVMLINDGETKLIDLD